MSRHVCVLATVVVAALAVAGAATAENYIVLYNQGAVSVGATKAISDAGGAVVATYGEIGVLIAKSSNPDFRTRLLARDSWIEEASPVSPYGVRLDDPAEASSGPPEQLPNIPATDSSEPLFGLQWDMRQIHTPEAHAITGGSPSVVVADIDTGIDFTHPDLAPNYDPTHSADCTSGAAAPLAPGNDGDGHGTHTAGTIAAASNGIGIVGVAPNVKIAGIKAGTNDGFFFGDAVVCAFMFAGRTHADVTNNSYFADPYLYNCRNDKAQHAIWKAESRAILFAEQQGVTVVSAAGNESDDLSHPSVDVISPDFPPGSEQERAVTNACVVIPVEVPGVIGVSATGNVRQTDGDNDPNDFLKAFYSSYGVSAVDVTAPGGDQTQVTPEAQNGRVLSTYPAARPCTRRVTDPGVGGATYCYLQGTSMASPHAAGIAALIISRYGDLKNPQNGKMRPNQVAAFMEQTADPQPCPTVLPFPYDIITQTSGEPQSCQGGPGFNSWYGNGQVNAYNAVTKTSGNQP